MFKKFLGQKSEDQNTRSTSFENSVDPAQLYLYIKGFAARIAWMLCIWETPKWVLLQTVERLQWS